MARNDFLFEIGWEVAAQLGGIYTVLRSKAKYMSHFWGQQYCLVGPYNIDVKNIEFEPAAPPEGMLAKIVKDMEDSGFTVHFGHWLITGKPKVMLIEPHQAYNFLGEEKYFLWQHHWIPTTNYDALVDKVLAFGYIVRRLLKSAVSHADGQIVAHCHEWMAASAIPGIVRESMPVKTVFTTHATYLGRILAMHDPKFYDHLPFYNWEFEAKKFNIEVQAKLERAAAHSATVCTTVSNVTAMECRYFFGKSPDVILPNGINFERFEALHEFQNLHRQYKEQINKFVMGHFFRSFSFDLDNTLYFLISGRFEYNNKGFNIVVDALARLNRQLISEGPYVNIVMFFITKRPYHAINADVLNSQVMLSEIRQTTHSIAGQLSRRLFYATASSPAGLLPDLNDLTDDYWLLRLKRTTHSWKTKQYPSIVTHNIVDDYKDELLQSLRANNLINRPEDRVFVVYHPDFITPMSPLLGMEYEQFVRGCHLGIFPSYYEPWGYTPLECIALGVPSITSDLSGFGNYVLNNRPYSERSGIYVIKRKQQSYEDGVQQLVRMMMSFIRLNRRQRITLRNRVEANATQFDWSKLIVHYETAYQKALEARYV